jgi:hypothetical protein
MCALHGRPRGRLRRHRNEPALHDARVHRAPAGRVADGRDARGPLADLLVARPRRQRQVPRLHHEGRQPRRGGHLRAARADPRPPRGLHAPAQGPARPRARRRHHPDRRGPPFRRRHHHARDLGAWRGRGLQRHQPELRALRAVARVRDPGSAVLVPEPGDHEIGAVFGPIMLVWFADARGPRGLVRVQCALGPSRAQPGLRPGLLHHPPVEVAELLGSIVLAITGRGGPVRRPGPLWPPLHHDRLVRGGIPGARAQLLRAGGVHDPAPQFRSQPVLLDGPRGFRTRRPDRPVHRRGDHREPGAHHRCLLPVTPGDPARVFPAAEGQPHERGPFGPDLCALRQHPPGDRVHLHRAPVRLDRPPRVGLRDRRDGHHGHHERGLFPRGPPELEVAALEGGIGLRVFPRHRPRLLRGQRAQARRRRLVSPRDRRSGPGGHAHVEDRAQRRVRARSTAET